jgi:DNA primase
MDIVQLYQDYSIDFKTEGHKHCRPGWANVPCPFCTGNAGYHLGYEINGNYFYCWRCGWHAIPYTISKLLGIPVQEAERIIKNYGLLIPTTVKDPVIKTGLKPYIMPSNTEPLTKQHRRYLESRGFDADLITQTWALVGTGPISFLDGLSFKFRIIAPVVWETQAVSFVSRDITNKQSRKYMVCPKEREIVFHKHILYGRQEHWKDTGICVEGPTDVWRLGPNAFATFGIKYTSTQIRQIAKYFKTVPVVYDDDPQAVVQANKLVAELKFRGVDAFRVDIEGDPGGMKQEDADYLVKQLIH